MTIDATYIGDSVYAEISSAGLKLTIQNGLSDDPSSTIVLDDQVWSALQMFVNAWKDAKQAERGSAPTHGVDIMTYEDRQSWHG